LKPLIVFTALITCARNRSSASSKRCSRIRTYWSDDVVRVTNSSKVSSRGKKTSNIRESRCALPRQWWLPDERATDITYNRNGTSKRRKAPAFTTAWSGLASKTHPDCSGWQCSAVGFWRAGEWFGHPSICEFPNGHQRKRNRPPRYGSWQDNRQS